MSLIIFLYAYYIFLAIWALIAVISLFHILSYGVRDLATVFATVVFVGVSGLMLSSSFYYIEQVNWTTPVSFFNIDFNPNNQFKF
ncbi:hypothetical protein L6270_00430 [Candidatus Parcubacteria bacterium]|nr:hypothetical protein [Patescibacteria group bacterium]MBU4309615.1 hypothetical protein [Patescibacteria group bacterium]MBU4432143.1 hypothetical protein [Patescibacteria group bacterium]MBU4577997.1 hypothetical protein [Patescibacteria group bacterium]MCG2696495.1 hypothetical protein [Candidatus Parcubacteria bacterium]